MEDLKPCPFCGGSAEIAYRSTILMTRRNKGLQYMYIHCTKCGARSGDFFWDEKAEMLKAWNRRVKHESIPVQEPCRL